MTNHNEKTPATAPTVNEGNELETGSITTAYMNRHIKDGNYVAWSGEELPEDEYATIIVPLRVVQEMHAEGAQLLDINKDCVESHDAAAREYFAEQQRKKRNELIRKVEAKVQEEFQDQLDAIDEEANKRAQAIHVEMDALVQVVLQDLEGK